MPPGTRRRSCSTATSTVGPPVSATPAPAASRYSALEPGRRSAPTRSGRPRRCRRRPAGARSASSARHASSAAAERVAVAGFDQERPRRRGPRATSRRGSPRRARRRAWPAAAGSRTPRRATGRPGRWRAPRSAARSRVLDPPGAHDPVARRRRRDGRRRAPPRPSPAGRPAPGRRRAWRAATSPNARTRPGQVLARLGRPDGQAERARSPPAGCGAQRPPRLAVADVRQVGHARVDDAHAGGVGPERVDHLAGDEGGVGVHPGPPAQRPADQPGVGQRRPVAQLGVVQRREVVHRDDGGGAARRRHHEVRPVDDVGRRR